MNPQFLTLDEVMDIHRDQIERYGGTLGVRDLELLESAIAAPQSGFGDQYLHGDLFEMASAYLELNGVETKIPNQVLVATVLAVAQGKAEKSAIGAFFRQHAKS
jgi:death on curing protein